MLKQKTLQNLNFNATNPNFRELKNTKISSRFIYQNGQKLLNLASNDYLGIASDKILRDEFLNNLSDDCFFGSGASRLIYSPSYDYGELESEFQKLFKNKKALIFNSGYSANLATINALNDENTLFLADKLIHASMIDALKMANFKRFKHNDTNELENLLKKYRAKFKRIIILCEGLYSMDGDYANLTDFKYLANEWGALLFVDEAHSFFSLHELGECDACGISSDFMLITFSKALGGMGAAILCDDNTKNLLVNTARSLIYSTALAPINIAWTKFILSKDFSQRRKNLAKNIELLGLNNSAISPVLCQDSKHALCASKMLAKHGYFIPAIRPPSVKQARLRISLRADILEAEILKLRELLGEI